MTNIVVNKKHIDIIQNAKKIYPSLENLNVKPSGIKQIFNHPNSYGYDVVTVEPVSAEEINITPSKEEQTKEGLFNKVTVTGDNNLIAENIKEGVNIFGVNGALQGGGADEYFYEILPNNPLKKNTRLINRHIRKIPKLNITGEKDFQYAFQGFSNITEIPQLDTSAVTTMSYAFDDCSSLTAIPLLNTQNVTTVSGCFRGCEGLTEIPQLDFSKCTTLSDAFSQCSNLQTIPLLNLSKATSVSSMLYSCQGLINLGGFYNLGEAYKTTSSANYSSYTLRLDSSPNLTHDSLMNVINNLYDIKSKGCNTQQLVLGNTNKNKLTASEIAIATNKGWTVS